MVILLHGYSLDGAEQERYMHLRPLAEARGFLYCYPDGTPDTGGINFWNGTDASTDVLNTKTDDAGYLRALIEEIASHFLVDRKQVHLIGASNGAFMTYRMAFASLRISSPALPVWPARPSWIPAAASLPSRSIFCTSTALRTSMFLTLAGPFGKTFSPRQINRRFPARCKRSSSGPGITMRATRSRNPDLRWISI
jgi:hypothetical protein